MSSRRQRRLGPPPSARRHRLADTGNRLKSQWEDFLRQDAGVFAEKAEFLQSMARKDGLSAEKLCTLAYPCFLAGFTSGLSMLNGNGLLTNQGEKLVLELRDEITAAIVKLSESETRPIETFEDIERLLEYWRERGDMAMIDTPHA